MSIITAQNCMDKAEIILQDITNDRFSEDELLGWFNDGEREVVALKPDAYIKELAVKLVEGVLQTIPTTAISLISLSHNMGTDGAVPGNIINLIDRKILDAQRKAWATDTASAVVRFYMFDDRKPRNFLVYPQQPASNQGYVMESYVDTPADIAKTGTMLLADIYANPIVHYMVAKALAKEPGYSAVSTAHMAIFNAELGVKEKAETVNDPNRRAKN